MKFTKEELDSFKKIYSEEFGEELSDKVASHIASKFINLMKLIYRPLKKIPRSYTSNLLYKHLEEAI